MSNIEIVRKNLGPVTAYKYAVQQGYTGTEQEFAALMASYATVAEEAEAAKDDAVDAKTAAEAAQQAAEAAAQTLVIDPTLTQAGQAADAKVVGGKITGLKEDLSQNTVSTDMPFEVVTGYQINQTTGAFDSKTGWERTGYIDIDGYESIEITTEYTLWNCAFYDGEKAMVSFMSIYADTGVITIPDTAKYIALSVASPKLSNVIVTVTRPSFKSNIANDLMAVSERVDYSYADADYIFVQGALSSTNGTLDTTSTRRISTKYMKVLTEKIKVHTASKYQSNVFFYSSETNGYISNIGWQNGDYILVEDLPIPATTQLIKVTLRNKADTASAIAPTDIQSGEFSFQYISKKANTIDLDKYDSLFVPTAYPNIIYACRDGRVRNDLPPNSVYAIKATAYNQYDKIRFSVTKTTDDEYVAVHDVTINNLAVNTDGTAISTTINTADCSLADLNQYDWGLKYGQEYAGLTVPILEDCIKLASIYNLSIILDIKWTVTDEDIDALTELLSKYGQTDAIFFAVNVINAEKFKAKNKRFSYLYAGTIEQMQSNQTALVNLLTGYNHVYIVNRPIGTAPTAEIIEFATVNNFDIMFSPIEGISELIALGFDKGITLMECHYIENIKKAVRDYADSLI